MYTFLDNSGQSSIWNVIQRSHIAAQLVDGSPCPSPWPIVVAPWHVFCVPLRCVGRKLPYTKKPSPFLPSPFDCLMFPGIINHLIMANEIWPMPHPGPLRHKIESLFLLLFALFWLVFSQFDYLSFPPLPLNWSSECIFSNWSFWPKFGKPTHLLAIKENSISLWVWISQWKNLPNEPCGPIFTFSNQT